MTIDELIARLQTIKTEGFRGVSGDTPVLVELNGLITCPLYPSDSIDGTMTEFDQVVVYLKADEDAAPGALVGGIINDD